MKNGQCSKPYFSVVLLSLLAILCLFITPSLLGCNAPEEAPSYLYGELVLKLRWQTHFESEAEITRLDVFLFNPNGQISAAKTYSTVDTISPVEQLEETTFEVLGGEYYAVIAVNLQEDISAAAQRPGTLINELETQVEKYRETYYGEARPWVAIEEWKIEEVVLFDKAEEDSFTCEVCEGVFASLEEQKEHFLPCGEHICSADQVADEHKAAPCQKEGHFLCDTVNHKAAICGEDGHYNCEEVHTQLLCKHFACATGNHTNLNCGHYACQKGDHTQLACKHFACRGGDHTKLDCGHYACQQGDHIQLGCKHYACQDGDHAQLGCKHYACQGGDHTQLPCKHYACAEGSHHTMKCGHYACDKEYGMQGCGHCKCEGEHYRCPICQEWNCADFSYPHELYYCGHILCNETMEEGHTECEHCGSCTTYGTHSAAGCVFPE